MSNPNNLSNIDLLRTYTSLTKLTLSNRIIINKEIYKAFTCLPHLKELCLKDTRIENCGLLKLTSLTNLQALDLGSTLINGYGLELLASFTNLTKLCLNNNSLIEGSERSPLAHIAHLTRLRCLDLRACGIDDTALKFLVYLIYLKELYLANNRLEGQYPSFIIFLDFKNLETLDLQNNSINDQSFYVSLARMTSLRNLYLGNNPIGNHGLTALTTLTNLSTLSLKAGKIGDEGVAALSHFINLTSLDLSNIINDNEAYSVEENDFKTIDFVFNLIHLKDIRLSGNGITDFTPLTFLANLKNLELSVCGIKRKELSFLSSLSNLRTLDISCNTLSLPSIFSLTCLVQLEELDLAGTISTLSEKKKKELVSKFAFVKNLYY